MRLKRLTIARYGVFDTADLRFATEPGRINLVVAPNGAGKSLLRHAFHDLLFDIPLQSPMRFRFNYAGMALHAEALSADGVSFEFGWSRQGKPQRTTTDPARFEALRNTITPRQLEQLFALDTARLRQGGVDLLGGQTLGEALLSGTGELARPKKLRQEIEARKAANWGVGKSKPPLNAALATLIATAKTLRDAVERPQARERQEAELDILRAKLSAARADQQAALAESRRLNRIAATRPHLTVLREAEAWLAAHPDVPVLPAGLEAPLDAARAAMVRAQIGLLAAEATVTQAREASRNIARDDLVGGNADSLSRLAERLGAATEAARDIVKRRAEHATTQDLIRRAMRDIGAAAPVEQAAALVPTVALMSDARAAIRAHDKLLGNRDAAAARFRAAARSLAAAEQVPPGAGAAVPDGLAPLLDEIRDAGNPVQRAEAAAAAERRTQAALAAALAKLPGWPAGALALRELPVPAASHFERLDAAVSATTRTADTATATRDDLRQQHDAAQKDLAALQKIPLPDTAAIAVKRADRDRGWRLIHQRAFSSGPPDLAGERAHAGDEPLPLVFERDLRAADDLADRRIAELDRIGEAERLTRGLVRLAADGAAFDQVAQDAATAAAEARRAWATALAPLGLPQAATIADLREWLSARLAVIGALEAAEVTGDEAAALARRQQYWVTRLAALLTAEQPKTELAALLAQADASLRAAEAARQERRVWEIKLAAARTDQQKMREDHEAAEQGFANWQAGWVTILERLGRPAGEAPDTTEAVLDRIGQLDQHDRVAATLAERIDEMQTTLDEFSSDVATLAAALDEPQGADIFATARALIARRDHAALQGSAYAQAQANLAAQQKTLDAARHALRTAETERDIVLARIGAADLDMAGEVLAAAREHTRHAELRDAAWKSVAGHGDGRARETLESEAAAMPPEDMEAARDKADAAATEAGTRAENAAIAVSRSEGELDDAARSQAALDAATAHEAARTVYARLLEEQLVLQVAGSMLARALESVQENSGDNVLARLSDLFGALTGGAYGVSVSDEDNQTIVAVEHRFPNETKKLDQLSEGTRDQLYLALRLMALRDSGAVLPFVADDILQTFDDPRAEAALRQLVLLSHHVQVIVLTHHPHIADIALRLGDAVHRQSLPVSRA